MLITGRILANKFTNVLRLARAEFSSFADYRNISLVKSFKKTVERDTHIYVESPINVRVESVDVQQATGHDQISVHIYSPGKKSSDFSVKQSAKRLELISTADSIDSADVCLIKAPNQLNLNINCLRNACVKVSKLLIEDFRINTEKGAVFLDDITAQGITVQSAEGDILCGGKLQAAKIDLKTGKSGSVSLNNVLSNNLEIATHAGNINIKSCYSDHSHLITALGDVLMQNTHRACTVDILQRGNLHVTGFEGQLTASLKSGDIFMHATKFTDRSSIFIHEKGKVELQVPDLKLCSVIIDLIADRICVDNDIVGSGRLMSDSHPQRFRYPIEDTDTQDEVHVECRNGLIELKKSLMPFYLIK